MYLGPFRWPSRSVWISALALLGVVVVFSLIGIDPGALLVVVGVVVLLVAAPRRAAEFRSEEMRKSRPDD